MQGFKHFLEWYFGVPPVGPGQGTSWHFQWRTPWPSFVPDWVVLIGGLLTAAAVLAVYFRDAKAASPVSRIVMSGLRLLAMAVVLIFLTELSLTVDRTGLPVVVVLIDDSASMSFEDQYSSPADQARVAQLLKSFGKKDASRINLAQAMLTSGNGKLLQQLIERHKLRVYRFSDQAELVGQGDYLKPDELPELIAELNLLKAEGRATRPGSAVRKVLDDLRGTPPSAIVLISDGIATTGDSDRLSAAAVQARDRQVPIFTVALGSAEPARDVQLYDMMTQEVAFVEDPITFSARIKAFGYKNQRLRVTLREQNHNEILAQKTIDAGSDGQPARVELVHTPAVEGEFDFVLEVTPLPDEVNASNNSEVRHVSVRRERIRVLLADSVPRYEFRYLKAVLEREKTIELKTVLQDADVDFAREDETALDHFPVKREELYRYDVVIFGDVNPGYLGSGVMESLREFVREYGGGMILVAGTSFNPLSYRGTPLEPLFPVKLSSVSVPAAEAAVTEGYRPWLTLEGRKSSSVFRFAESEEASVEIWNRLPELYWLAEAKELQPGAIVFAEHPNRAGESGKLPVIVKQRIGAGMVLFHATDDLWLWRFRVGDLYYGRYWVQAIRYLSRGRLLGRDKSAELYTVEKEYDRGDTVVIRLAFRDERKAPLEKDGVAVMVERKGDIQRQIRLSRLPHAPETFEGQLPRAAEGAYHAWVVSPSFDNSPPTADFTVLARDQESQLRTTDRAELAKAASMTGGRHYAVSEIDQLAADLPRGQPVPLQSEDPIPLWNRWELLLLFTALLTSEWLLRKRLRLI